MGKITLADTRPGWKSLPDPSPPSSDPSGTGSTKSLILFESTKRRFMRTRICLVILTSLLTLLVAGIWILCALDLARFNRDAPAYSINPEQIHLSLGANPNQLVVTWVTQNGTDLTRVWYQQLKNCTTTDTKGSDQDYLIATGSEVLFTDGGSEKRSMFIHRVYLSNLAPNATYKYYAGSSTSKSPELYFRTLPTYDASAPASWSPRLAIFGDLSTKHGQIYDDLEQGAEQDLFDLIMHIGDLAYDLDGDQARVGDEFMRKLQPFASKVPYLVCPGNHEQAYNFSNYENRFTMHSEGDSTPSNHFWSYNIGPAHIIAFSTEFHFFPQYGTEQVWNQMRWLEKDLEEANREENRKKHPWIITMGHRPMYSEDVDTNDEDDLIRTGNLEFPGFEQLFFKHGVDLSFWGHVHNYERAWPLFNGVIYNGSAEAPYTNPGAPVHIITGSGGVETMDPIYRKQPAYNAFASSDFGLSLLDILNRTHLRLRQISDNLDGKVIDDFYLIKDRHGPYKWPNQFQLDSESSEEEEDDGTSNGNSLEIDFIPPIDDLDSDDALEMNPAGSYGEVSVAGGPSGSGSVEINVPVNQNALTGSSEPKNSTIPRFSHPILSHLIEKLKNKTKDFDFVKNIGKRILPLVMRSLLKSRNPVPKPKNQTGPIEPQYPKESPKEGLTLDQKGFTTQNTTPTTQAPKSQSTSTTRTHKTRKNPSVPKQIIHNLIHRLLGTDQKSRSPFSRKPKTSTPKPEQNPNPQVEQNPEIQQSNQNPFGQSGFQNMINQYLGPNGNQIFGPNGAISDPAQLLSAFQNGDLNNLIPQNMIPQNLFPQNQQPGEVLNNLIQNPPDLGNMFQNLPNFGAINGNPFGGGGGGAFGGGPGDLLRNVFGPNGFLQNPDDEN